jgi:hypothetical protein
MLSECEFWMLRTEIQYYNNPGLKLTTPVPVLQYSHIVHIEEHID